MIIRFFNFLFYLQHDLSNYFRLLQHKNIVVIIEFNNCHDEVAIGLSNSLNHNNVNHVCVFNRYLKKRSDSLFKRANIKYYYFSYLFIKYIVAKSYFFKHNYIIINSSFDYYLKKDALSRWLKHSLSMKNKFYIVHDIQKSILVQSHVRKLNNFYWLSDKPNTKYGLRPLPIINNKYATEPNRLSNITKILIIGTGGFDMRLLIKEVSLLSTDNYHIDIIGNHNLPSDSDTFSYSNFGIHGRVSSTEMHNLLAKCHFILAPNKYYIYTHKISGSVQHSRSYTKPLIIHHQMASTLSLTKKNSVIYSSLENGISYASSMDNKAYVEMCSNLYSYSIMCADITKRELISKLI